MEVFVCLAIVLLFGHVFMDYPMQNDFMAKFKNPAIKDGPVPWWHVMLAHCVLHAGFSSLVLMQVGISIWLILYMFVVEVVVHFMTDVYKCRGWLTPNMDQFIHIVTKLSIALVAGFIV